MFPAHHNAVAKPLLKYYPAGFAGAGQFVVHPAMLVARDRLINLPALEARPKILLLGFVALV